MPARLRLLESLPPGAERPLCLIDGLMWPHGKKKVARDTQLVRNTDGGFSLLLMGRCIVRFQRDHLEVRLPRYAQSGDMIPAWVLADRLAGVLALWGATLVVAPDRLEPAGNPPETGAAHWFVLRGNSATRLTEGLHVPYVEPKRAENLSAPLPARHAL